MAVAAGFDAFGVDATYTPPAGSPVAVTVIVDQPTEDSAIGPGLAVSRPSHTADLRRSEVAAPAAGATLAIGPESFRVRKASLDRAGLVWRLDLEKQ